MTRSLLFALAVVATLTLPRLAFAGCGDGMVARVDTADVITFDTAPRETPG